MTDYGLKVSKAGYDVKTAILDNLSFTSDHSQLKISLEGSLSITYTAGQTGDKSSDVLHGLGYRPCFIAFFLDDEDNYYYPAPGLSETGIKVNITTDSTKVYININKGASSGSDYTYIVKYFLLVEDI